MDNEYVGYEDTVQCFFFSFSNKNVKWEQLRETLNSTTATLMNDYIWHQDDFKIILPLIENDYGFPPHLISRTCFGDNIEDEWFIAYLVFKLTEIHRDLIVKVDDNDGDFLLIEAADLLPSWANPETTFNRVFIYNNHIHLIPPSIAELNAPLKIDKALKLIKDYTEQTRASIQIENAILKRIGCYPDRIQELIHRTTVTIPINLATLLILRPALISSLVNTYCNHDDIDAKLCHKLNLDNCVDVTIKFTKFQYAMILHCKQMNNVMHHKISTSNTKGEIGFKLACGFNIIMNESKKDKFTSTGYNKFIGNLTTNGYFKGNIPGSKNYNELIEKANNYYMDTECSVISCVYENISQLMASKEFLDLEETLKQNNNLYLFNEDNDNWLNIDPEKLDDFLQKSYRKQVQSDDLMGPSVVTTGLSNFLSQRSDYEGVEENGNVCIDDNNINFNADQFFQTVENMLNKVTINVSDDESSELSDNDVHEDFFATEQLLDQELAAKLSNEPNRNSNDHAVILSNLVNSIKEEGISGPTSNILRSIGINKRELLDSDDDSD